MTSKFKYRINYVAAWLSAASEQLLREQGVERRVHMTTFFDGCGQMASVKPFPWVGPQSARIAAVEEWKVGTDLHVVAVMADCRWSQAINNFFHDQGVSEDLPHRPHLTLEKRVDAGAAAKFQNLVGTVLWFDRHGGQEDDRAPFSVQGDLALRDWRVERVTDFSIKVVTPPMESGIRKTFHAFNHDTGLYLLAEAMLKAPRVLASLPDAEAHLAEAPGVAEFKVDTFRPAGGGGWIPAPDIGVRVTHVDTGLYAESSDDRSIHRNKAAAMAKLLPMVEAAKLGERNGHVLLSHITDLANLPSDNVEQFVKDLPGLIAMMKIAKQECDESGVTLRQVMPLLRFAPEKSDVVINAAGRQHVFQSQELVDAAKRHGL